ncbi:glycosyltransferase family 4 protein [Nocardioides yefusunii]|uniref:Glycosyltransferase family 4 protein n=1 Tax=Nocardioides yefusunii TaxID=2500546 RepID=A0ABW1QTS8_9ACTN|nr:glycosyltransferase family 4 protein [Nocardioides yefusunii]
MTYGVLTQWFDPEPGPAAVPGVLARELATRGHQIEVLTGFPNYPVGRVYEGYKQSWSAREQVSPGVTVNRVPLYPSHDGGAVGRAGNYLSFAATASMQVVSHLKDCDAVWVYNSPATVPLAARRLKGRAGVPFLLHVMDVWPDSVLHSGMLDGPLGKLPVEKWLTGLVKRGYDAAAHVAVTSPGQRDLLLDRGLSADRVSYVPLWADEDQYHPRDPDRSLLPPQVQDAALVWMYAGAMGHVQRLDRAVRAATAAADAGVHLVFVGQGIAEQDLKALVAELGAPNVHFMGRREPSEMGDLIAAGDAHLVSLDDSPLLRVTMPSKIQSIMASGRPIIATCSGDAADVVRSSGGGVVVGPDEDDRLVDALLELAGSSGTLDTWGQTARRFYEKTFSRERGVDAVEATLAEISR